MTMGETNAPRIFERKIVSKIHGLVKEGEHWGMAIRSNKDIENILQAEDIVKFIKSRAAVTKYIRKTARYTWTDYKINTAIAKKYIYI
jgi:hypothetical protein